jgi:opacity protein-like surface antigen
VKKLILAMVFVFALSSVALATPLTDYSQGKAALDITYRVSPDFDTTTRITGIDGSLSKTFDGDNHLEWGLTYGVGNNWALQYRQANPKATANYGWSNDREASVAALETSGGYLQSINLGIEPKAKVDEYNVLYKLDKNFFLFTGLVRATPSVKLSVGGEYYGDTFGGNIAIQGHDKNIWQFGLQAVAPIADKFNAYGIVSFGSDYRNWEAGLGYEVAKNLELNVNYRDMKIDNMTMGGISINDQSYDVKSDAQIKGWGFGVTYKF